MLFIIIAFIFVLTMGYFFLMIFFPEWVGMSGDVTKKTMESHKDDTEENGDQQNTDLQQ